MTTNEFPTDPNAETIGLPSESGEKGSIPEISKFATQGMPSEIGRYKILGTIASGGMGVVYEAMQEAPRRRVALKIIKSGAANEMALRRFEFESQILAKLNHPNIAKIYEAGTWESEGGEVPFFAMEYIPGALGVVSYCDKRTLSIPERLHIFEKICDAVHHGHQKGVIHRDLKPDNILVDNNGEPKIIDFGVARATDADLAVTTMQTTMGQLIGTLQYMSPEQCDADPDRIDTRSDVYALGVILFQLLSGCLPYDLRRLAIHEAVRIIQDERPLAMSTVNVSLRGDIETIVMKALDKDKERRYQSAAEFANDIEHFLNNEPIIARPLSITYQLRLFTKKYKRTCAAVVLCCISIVLGLLGTTWGMVEANRGWTAAEHQRLLVENRNEVLQGTVDSLLTGVKDVVQDLGNSADAQRALLDLARENLDAIHEGESLTDAQQVELAVLLMRNARSHLSVSGVGFGSVTDAVEALQQAGHVLDSVDLTNADANIVQSANRIKLDREKYLAEIEETIASMKSTDFEQAAHYQKAAAIYEDRRQAGAEYYSESNDWKGLEVQWSSLLGLGNVLFELGEPKQSLQAYQSALPLVEQLMTILPKKTLRWKRNFAITCYSIARVASETEALPKLNQGIELSRSILIEEPEHARRSRDLAMMLGLRGVLLLDSNKTDALLDLQEATTLLTKRAIDSPQEKATQVDFEENLINFSTELIERGLSNDAFELCNPALNQLECIASAESLTGRPLWEEIITRVRGHIEQNTQAAVPEQ